MDLGEGTQKPQAAGVEAEPGAAQNPAGGEARPLLEQKSPGGSRLVKEAAWESSSNASNPLKLMGDNAARVMVRAGVPSRRCEKSGLRRQALLPTSSALVLFISRLSWDFTKRLNLCGFRTAAAASVFHTASFFVAVLYKNLLNC